jgi:hypothetical protein
VGLTTSELAAELKVTPGRVSQMVAAGQLDGTFTGSGRARRFAWEKVVAALPNRLHPGQMLGNGAKTRKALAAAREQAAPEEADDPPRRRDGPLDGADPDRYELARTQKAEEEARKLRRQNAEAEGTYVLASEVERQVAAQIGQEVREFETMLRDGARRVADELGVEFGQVRKLLIETWRTHRGKRSEAAAETAEAATPTDAEEEQDI